mmetsp:Transcript_88/g.252  ORF Transcript_88/g.252 Transcript_88/m.252 type:complete len:217 (-) Transcript_88:237-887(-)
MVVEAELHCDGTHAKNACGCQRWIALPPQERQIYGVGKSERERRADGGEKARGSCDSGTSERHDGARDANRLARCNGHLACGKRQLRLVDAIDFHVVYLVDADDGNVRQQRGDERARERRGEGHPRHGRCGRVEEEGVSGGGGDVLQECEQADGYDGDGGSPDGVRSAESPECSWRYLWRGCCDCSLTFVAAAASGGGGGVLCLCSWCPTREIVFT